MPPDHPLAAYATATQRFIALVIDGIISLPVIWFANKVIGSGSGYPVLLGQLMSMAYFTGFESSKQMATPGKMLTGLFVIDKYGSRLTLLRALARYAVYSVPFLPFLFCIASPGFMGLAGKLAQLERAHDLTALQHFWDDAAARTAFFGIALSGIGGLFLFGTLFWLPMVATQEKIGLHDWTTKTRVFRRRDERKTPRPL